MRLRLVTTTCVLAAILSPQTVASAHVSPYVRLDLGHSLGGKLNLKPKAQPQQNLDLDTNLLTGAALGADFQNGIRLELEATHRKNGLNAFDGAIESGDMVANTIMSNLFYDFLRGSPIRPYVGVGAGAIKVDLSTFHNTGAVNLSATKTMPAYQAMIGVTVPLSRHLSLDAGYRYFATGSADVPGRDAAGSSLTHKVSFDQSASRIGLSYRFGGEARPAPPQVPEMAMPETADTSPMALPEAQTSEETKAQAWPTSGLQTNASSAPQETQDGGADEVSLSDFETSASLDEIAQSTPAPTPALTQVEAPPVAPVEARDAKSFVVHFAFDSADLTLQAVTEISEAATYAIEGQAKSVNVSGYTDRSGGLAYNLKLSKRRALVVVNALVEDGVDPTVINFVYRGEADPVVATPNGVPEPLNRRTQIDVAF